MTPVDQALPIIDEAMKGRKRLIVAIDGPCASGKTTMAAELAARRSCPVIHMDDFFLRPEQRTRERLSEAGGNLDRERFAQEILRPLATGEDFTYRPFLCRSMTFGHPVRVPSAPLVLIEGSYACHPALRRAYDLCFFLSVEPSIQRERLRLREGEARLAVFEQKWIPLEEKYFRECRVQEDCILLKG